MFNLNTTILVNNTSFKIPLSFSIAEDKILEDNDRLTILPTEFCIKYDITSPFPGNNLYLIRSGTTNSYKIGISCDPVSRLSQLQTGNPHSLSLIACCPGDRILEKKYHEKYKAKRQRGEWFEFSQEEENEIVKSMALKSMGYPGDNIATVLDVDPCPTKPKNIKLEKIEHNNIRNPVTNTDVIDTTKKETIINVSNPKEKNKITHTKTPKTTTHTADLEKKIMADVENISFIKCCIEGDYDSVVSSVENRGDCLDLNKGFIVACEYGHEDIVQLMIEYGDDLLNFDSGLTIACKNGHEKIVRLIINDRCVHLDCGKALIAACKRGFGNIVKLMIENDDECYISLGACNKVLVHACKAGYDDIVECMIKYIVGFCTDDYHVLFFNEGLIAACKGGNENIIKLMIENGANNFIEAVTYSDDGPIKDIILKWGGSNDEDNVFVYAASIRDLDLFKISLKRCKPRGQQRVAFIAGYNSYVDFIKVMIESKHQYLGLAYYLAELNGKLDVVDMLKQHGVKRRSKIITIKDKSINISKLLVSKGNDGYSKHELKAIYELFDSYTMSHKTKIEIAYAIINKLLCK